MKRLKGIIALLLVLLMATSCSLLGGPTIEKAEDNFDKGKYDEGVEMLEALIDEDELNFDAWYALVEGQLDEEEFDDADDTLKDLLEVIEDNYDEDDDEIDYEEVVEDFMDATEDLAKDQEPGDWANELAMPYADISYLSWDTYGTSDVIELDYDMMYISEDTTLLYNLDGDRVKADDTTYKGSIQLPDAEGDVEIAVAPINALGMVGDTAYATLTIAELMAAPEVDLEPGYHEGPIEVHLLDYVEEDNIGYYYTLDGSDPQMEGEWLWDNAILLDDGDYTLRLVIYDYDTGMYSDELRIDYEIENMMVVSEPTTLTVGILKDFYDLYDQMYWMLDDLSSYEENIDFELLEYDNYDNYVAAFADGTLDAIISWNGEILYVYDYLADVSQILDFSGMDFFPGVEEGITFGGETLIAPVSVAPSHLMMSNWELDSQDLMEVTSIDELSTYFTYDGWSDYGLAYAFLEPENFFPVYMGLGGSYSITDMNTIQLDYDSVVATLTYLDELLFTYGAATEAADYDVYWEIIENSNAYLTFDAPWRFADDEIRYNYEPIGNMPLYEGYKTVPWLYVDGLMVNINVVGDPAKSAAIRVLYQYMATDYDYSYYYSELTSEMNGLPADRNLIDEYYYSYYMNDTLEFMKITEGAVAYPPLMELQINYVYDNLFDSIYAYLNGDTTIDVAAQEIVDAMALE